MTDTLYRKAASANVAQMLWRRCCGADVVAQVAVFQVLLFEGAEGRTGDRPPTGPASRPFGTRLSGLWL
jgi:hypothetical protein